LGEEWRTRGQPSLKATADGDPPSPQATAGRLSAPPGRTGTSALPRADGDVRAPGGSKIPRRNESGGGFMNAHN